MISVIVFELPAGSFTMLLICTFLCHKYCYLYAIILLIIDSHSKLTQQDNGAKESNTVG